MKKPIMKSAPMAWAAMLLIAIVLVCTFSLRPAWWAFIDIFFFFMMAFCHAVACTAARMGNVAKQLDLVALVCGILGIVALLAEGIAYFCLFS